MKRFVILVLAIIAGTLAIHAQDPAPREIVITAKRFEFTPNQIAIKRGETVTLRVSALDRDHGFYQKDLKIDLDLTPNHESAVTITPEKSGRFVAICDNFCGLGHGNMKMIINVE
ncbi:MAG TPA: cupredoxin domain-containing protein [Thermoanaerobaculia bacterium]|jgi:cytochrome c oxidase subunit 2|nr:cupredoxin domain-containing protein [Thermoanaerobaculia bacterium]